MSRGRLIWLTAAALLVVATAMVTLEQRRHGVVRDEVVYMNAGTGYASWWGDLVTFESGTLTEQSITAAFGGKRVTDNNSEHPPLMKTLFGISEKALGGVMSRTSAYRFPNALLYGVLVALVFLFAAGRWGFAEGVVAAGFTFFMPRALFHAGLAAFDAPVVTLWFATLYAYYKSLASPWRWGVLFGVFFGLTLATKHNAIILPAAILPHWIWVVARQVRDGRRADAARPLGAELWGAVRARGPLTVPAMLVIGPLVLIAVWPWLWFDTWAHASRWLSFHFDHVHYNFEYLGRNWNHPPFPWHVSIVTTLVTVPVVTLVAGALGAGLLLVRARRGVVAQADRAPALLLFLSAGVAMGPFLLRTTPIFGAEKHWATAMPTICIYAAIGLVAFARLASDRAGLKAPRAAVAVLATLAMLAAAVETFHAQPYALTHYNALAGGAPGGADLGMNRQFWGYSARGVIPFLERFAREHGGGRPLPVYTHDADMSWSVYARDGVRDASIPSTANEWSRGIESSKLALIVHERHFNRHDYLVWQAYGTVQPVYVLTVDGVPIVTVYARPELTKQSQVD
ncbi:MAG TPA: glycosyltransferase family 39 protein [Kofleriaceae bacterium]|nr:glycosyltransferase family 39 protein [Kofleriaceae bacterium]